MIWPLLVLLGILLSLWLRWRYKNRNLLIMAEKIPGPTALPGVGNALRFMCNSDGFVMEIKNLMSEYGDILRFWLRLDLCVIVSNPDYLKTLLSNPKISIKGPLYKYMADVLGGGILSGSGATWRKHRKIATPNYSKRAIESFEGIFNKEVDVLMKEYRSDALRCRQFDIYHNIVRTTSHAVCQTLMGLTKEQTINLPHLQCLIDKIPRSVDIVFDRMTKWYLQIDPLFWMTDSYRFQKKFITMMTDFSKQILKYRISRLKTLEENNKKELMDTDEDVMTNTELSVIDRFILSSEFNNEEMIKETFTIFISSQEPPAKISSFLLLMMAYHPDCQEKLYNEIKSVMGDTDRPVRDEDLKQMPYLEMVFKEVLRLFPIGVTLQRTISEDIVIGSKVLPAGCSLVIPIYHLHRDPRFWERPDDFEPERFSPKNTKLLHPYCYIPFSLGPMDCLGRYFGTKLVKTICVRVLREFEVSSLESYHDLRVAISMSAESVNGFHVILKTRNIQ